MKVFLSLVLVVLLGACGGSKPASKLPTDAVLLAFGDSLTYGTGAAQGESYPAQLEKLIGRRVVNAGIPGEVSAAGLERLPGVLDEVRPAVLILCHGGNDFLRKLDDARAADNVRGMIAHARDRGIPVVLVATPKPTLPPTVPAFFRELAAESGATLDDAILRTVLSDRALKADLVHPNAKGYREVASAVERALKRSGSL